jgi:hypothetical protein
MLDSDGILSTSLEHSDVLVASLPSSTIFPAVSMVGHDLMSVTLVVDFHFAIDRIRSLYVAFYVSFSLALKC